GLCGEWAFSARRRSSGSLPSSTSYRRARPHVAEAAFLEEVRDFFPREQSAHGGLQLVARVIVIQERAQRLAAFAEKAEPEVTARGDAQAVAGIAELARVR